MVDNISTTNSSFIQKEREMDTIPFRIDFIKQLLNKKKLNLLVDLDNDETDNFIPTHNDLSNSNNNSDTRYVLNKKIHNFYKIISQIGGKLLYVKSGTTGHTFKGICKTLNIGDSQFTPCYAVKVVAYPKKGKYGDMFDTNRPENAELVMIKTLSYFVVGGQTPHIVLPMGTFDTSIKPFVDLIEKDIVDENNKKYSEFITRFKNDEYYDIVSILISEWANRGDLLDFVRKNYKKFYLIHWKVIFFQILSTLAVIHSKFPAFRHNDLKANNVLVHKISSRTSKFLYKVMKCEYIIPNIGYQIKLWDFDFACIDKVVYNSKVNSDWAKAINITYEQNRYYDMHYFFNTLKKKGFFPQFSQESCIPQEVKDFVNRLIPPKYQSGRYVHPRGRILINDEYTTPDIVIKTDPFFEEFRTNRNTNNNYISANNVSNGTSDSDSNSNDVDVDAFLKNIN
jgi:hypothetical protein